MITKEMKINEVITNKPEISHVFASYGMGCIHCQLAHSESVEEACVAHGIDLEEMLEKLNA